MLLNYAFLNIHIYFLRLFPFQQRKPYIAHIDNLHFKGSVSYLLHH